MRKGTTTDSYVAVRTYPAGPIYGYIAKARTPVNVVDERTVDHVRWYKIGDDSWVHAGYVRTVLDEVDFSDDQEARVKG